MFGRTSTEKLTKKIKFLLIQKRIDQESLVKRIGVTPEGVSEDLFIKSVIDPRLTAEENAILVRRLLEVREAFSAVILSNRADSHDRDFVAG
jgi:hypothetical protein